MSRQQHQHQPSPPLLPRSVTHVWRGGCPGFEASWNHPLNWDCGYVPSWRSHVLVPKRVACPPSINQPVDDVTSLTLETGATLSVGIYGEITIDGLFTPDTAGLRNAGFLQNLGEIFLRNVPHPALRNAGFMHNAGMIFFDQTGLDERLNADPRFCNEGELVDLSV